MKRHLDLIRLILLEVEASDSARHELTLAAPGYSPEDVAYHVKLLHQAGYLEAIDFSSHTALEWRPTALTWDGHEFLDSVRTAKVWTKVKAELKDHAISLPFSLVKALALKIAAAQIGL